METTRKRLTTIRVGCLLNALEAFDNSPKTRAEALALVPRTQGSAVLVFEAFRLSSGERQPDRVFRAVIDHVDEETGDVVLAEVREMFCTFANYHHGDLGWKGEEYIQTMLSMDDIGDPSERQRWVEIRSYQSGISRAERVLHSKAVIAQQRTELEELRRILKGWPIPAHLLRLAEFFTPHRLELLIQLISRTEGAGSNR